MNLLFKLTDEDFGIAPQEMNNCHIRLAARGIVLREDGKIALQNKSNKKVRNLWVEPKETLRLITECYDKLLPSDYDDVYDTRFVVLRDRKILEYYLNK